MIGEHRKLMREGQSGRAVVTSVEEIGGSRAGLIRRFRLGLRVHLDSGSTVDASGKVGGWGGTDLWFTAGDIVPVRYDAADHTRVAVDEPVLRAERAASLRASADAAIERSERKLAGLPDLPHGTSLPTDAQLQASYAAWRRARAKAGQSRTAHKRAQATDD